MMILLYFESLESERGSGKKKKDKLGRKLTEEEGKIEKKRNRWRGREKKY